MKIVLILFAIFLLVSPSLGQSEKCIFQQPNHVGICGGTSTICTLYLQFYREEKKLAQINAEQKENIEIDKNFTTEESLDQLILEKLKSMLQGNAITPKEEFKKKFKEIAEKARADFKIKKEKIVNTNTVKNTQTIQPKLNYGLKNSYEEERIQLRNNFVRQKTKNKIKHYSLIPKDYNKKTEHIPKRGQKGKENHPSSSISHINRIDSLLKSKNKVQPKQNNIILPLRKEKNNNVNKSAELLRIRKEILEEG